MKIWCVWGVLQIATFHCNLSKSNNPQNLHHIYRHKVFIDILFIFIDISWWFIYEMLEINLSILFTRNILCLSYFTNWLFLHTLSKNKNPQNLVNIFTHTKFLLMSHLFSFISITNLSIMLNTILVMLFTRNMICLRCLTSWWFFHTERENNNPQNLCDICMHKYLLIFHLFWLILLISLSIKCSKWI